MNKVTVYRVENKAGLGPYHTTGILPVLLAFAHVSDDYPGWHEDLTKEDYNKLRKEGDFVFSSGFESIQQAEEWFDGWMPELKISGFEITPYIVNKESIINSISGKQIIFKKP